MTVFYSNGSRFPSTSNFMKDCLNKNAWQTIQNSLAATKSYGGQTAQSKLHDLIETDTGISADPVAVLTLMKETVMDVLESFEMPDARENVRSEFNTVINATIEREKVQTRWRKRQAELALEACPSCGCLPGDGETLGCLDDLGCGAPRP